MHHVRRTSMPKADGDHLDLDTLLHPANAFAHPADVVNDPDLTLSEKRAGIGCLRGRSGAHVAAAAGEHTSPFR
jgi:hypothetical protein